MIKLLADENVPRGLVYLIREQGVDIVRLQDLKARGISDKELIDMSNRLGRAILTRDQDFTSPHLLSLVKNGVICVFVSTLKE